MDISLNADKMIRDEVALFKAVLTNAAEIVALRREGDCIIPDDVEKAKERFVVKNSDGTLK